MMCLKREENKRKTCKRVFEKNYNCWKL